MKSTFRSKSRPEFSRRQFLATTAAAIALPTFIPASALGRAGRPAPSDRIVVGIVGWGMMGPGNTSGLMAQKDCQVVAACDLDKGPLQKAVDAINKKNGNTDCKAHADYREMIARDDIDAVMLAIPDHWHAIASVDCANRKKHIYGEKPLARTIAEQQAIVRAVQKNNVTWQTGSWQRSRENFHKAAEIVRNGLIGKVKHVEVGLPGGHVDFKGTKDKMQPSDPPPELDYDRWVGPSQMIPYIEGRVHTNWRWHYNFGAGQLLDWVGHHCDIAHWGLDFDDVGPTEVEGEGEFPPKDAVWNTATKYRVNLKYPKNVTMTMAGGHNDIKMGARWIGEDGWVWSIATDSTPPTPSGKPGRPCPTICAKSNSRNHATTTAIFWTALNPANPRSPPSKSPTTQSCPAISVSSPCWSAGKSSGTRRRAALSAMTRPANSSRANSARPTSSLKLI